MPARTFVPPVPPGTPLGPAQRSGFRMQLPRAVQRAVADADAARRRAAMPPPSGRRQPSAAANAPIVPLDLGRLFGRAAPAAAAD